MDLALCTEAMSIAMSELINALVDESDQIFKVKLVENLSRKMKVVITALWLLEW